MYIITDSKEIPNEGFFTYYTLCGADDAVKRLRARHGQWKSYITDEQTRYHTQSLVNSEWPVFLSREKCRMEPGDEALVVMTQDGKYKYAQLNCEIVKKCRVIL
jgi:hypothetical protein